MILARESYVKACNFGEGSKCLRAGVFYYDGEGGERDLVRARDLFRKGCDLKVGDACLKYSMTKNMTSDTRKVPENSKAHIIWQKDPANTPPSNLCVVDLMKMSSGGAVAPYLVPGSGGNKVGGALIRSVKKGQFFDEMGFVENDVVFNINGKPLASSQDIISAFLVLKKDSKNTFIVKRGDRTLTISKDCPTKYLKSPN